MKLRKLPQEGLKLLACVTMLLDHIGATLILDSIALAPDRGTAQTLRLVYYVLRSVGRIAFPVYCFLLAEGVRRTRNPRRYLLRLAIGAALTELPFDLLFYGGWSWGYSSAMVTLLLGCLYGLAAKRVPQLWLRAVLVLPFMVLAKYLGANYGINGVGIIALFLLTEELPGKRWIQTLGLALLCWRIGGAVLPIGGTAIPVQMMGVLAMVPICLYSGEKLTRNIWVQWGFYLFYPLHLAVLWLLTL